MIRLLVVDDAPFIREIVRHSLAGFLKTPATMEIVGEAEDGEEAIRLADQLRPDVILMDIVLPLKNGIDATREILSRHPSIRVIGFSTNDHESVVLKAMDAGCCSFIVKPFQSDELASAIQEAFESKSA